ncbi:hypothetical protein SKAU_G00410330 [Synaphobranchus kaupii]|uniref:Uncharacterized protein n=1 Tax=Synaphobranchus kaupii TaxID=118154 RepID=A0A9Q1E7M2_SYNKA|nr:hypothetical protein SKAU_G00410330 [Synaphobranchus kaupii]
MDAKAKSGAAAPKAAPAPKAEKPAEKAPPRKENPAPAEPAPAAPAPEKPPEDGAADHDGAADKEAAPEGTDAGEASTDSLESLKPFLIGGAVIAVAAILNQAGETQSDLEHSRKEGGWSGGICARTGKMGVGC